MCRAASFGASRVLALLQGGREGRIGSTQQVAKVGALLVLVLVLVLVLIGVAWFGFGLVWFGLVLFGFVWFAFVWFCLVRLGLFAFIGLVWFGLVWFDFFFYWSDSPPLLPRRLGSVRPSVPFLYMFARTW